MAFYFIFKGKKFVKSDDKKQENKESDYQRHLEIVAMHKKFTSTNHTLLITDPFNDHREE